ncbi:hypothetical protein DB30_08112 [Enhygromyxa salina]|uniref:Glycosyltransferase RgtA/B/C/D-like domain-containing protein n=1 Tax=Enhygromyxa salina TaxID=215803 RepID=A0A0C2CUT8_9BACT|nr:hypothetical protein DB30_08112 [Enhygromyxa salina]
MGLIVVLVGSAWVREPGFSQGGFASHDVAGILYNAMVLEHGGLPYVDTLELKAPGSFYLAKWFAGPEARDISRFQVAANLWALLALACVAGLAWRLWGRLGAVMGAGLYALHDAHLDSMDANYVTWANLPQIASFWAGIEALRVRSERWRPSAWMLAGALAGFAALCKRPDGIVLVPLLIMAFVGDGGESLARAKVSRGDGWARVLERAGDPAWVLLGFGLAHLPIVAQYVAAGEFRALFEGYFVSRWGLRYLGAREAGLAASAWEGALALAHFVGLALVLAAFSCVRGVAERVANWRAGVSAQSDQRLRELGFVCAWLLAMLVAASLGFRFYKGYFLAVAAPMCVLAAAPCGLLGRRCTAHWVPRSLALALCSVLVVRALLMLDHVRHDRAQPHDLGGRRIAKHLLDHTEPDDRIWMWGWHLWDVYPLTGRMSGSRIYKSLGILSQPNDDTWRRPASPLRFVESEYSRQLIADLEASRPAYVVLGSTVPHREFKQLHAFLDAHYRRDRRVRIGRVQLWKRRNL